MSEIVTNNDALAAELRNSTSEVVAAYLSRNNISEERVSVLINSVYDTFAAKAGIAVASIGTGSQEVIEKPSAAQIKKSVSPDAIVSFIDGKNYKSMKRHLSIHGYTPESYREKYGLPADYPMVSANYSAARSELARSLGLGQARRKDTADKKAA